ncbi:MAG: hypothetical protein KAW91_03510 [candidate division Zixibacteria bacterium]|nr:hypothetical protein [candidate division Zixibacteria bacterium]MCK4607571.1 hypothetical protein [candidate division Zixibacteria bacterium]
MESLDLLLICVSAFVAVFCLLAVLALVMRIIIFVFPQKEAAADAAMIAAIALTVSALYPGTSITKVEEIK